ncbi:MAG: ATP-binding cassette domain-containing protein, partial [Methylococcales bacterium]
MDSLLKVKDLSVQFPLSGKGWFPKKRFIQAVDQLTFDLNPGEILGIVGESGCGKTTLARTIVGLLKPTSGRIYLFGDNLTEMDETGFRSKRQQIQLIFQDPLAALNPRMTIGNIVAEPLREFHPELGRDQIQREVKSLLGRVGILPSQINRYPHQFSGGQCQRVGIARALIVKPKLLLCDEAVSALDVSVQAQIVNLLLDLKKEMGLSIVFISHDLRIVRQLCDRVLVMYLGKIVEINTRQEIYQNPK